ncbi:MAG TPA: hypothetical protein VHO47_02810 [Candidatus Babeliales bacterium]|nr:hypothetical protein [Candidatus Babeliales bacterium]
MKRIIAALLVSASLTAGLNAQDKNLSDRIASHLQAEECFTMSKYFAGASAAFLGLKSYFGYAANKNGNATMKCAQEMQKLSIANKKYTQLNAYEHDLFGKLGKHALRATRFGFARTVSGFAFPIALGTSLIYASFGVHSQWNDANKN